MLGHDMARDRFAALARMNFSSPYIALPHRLSVRREPARLRPPVRRAASSGRIAELARELDLREFLHRPAGNCPPAKRRGWRWPRR